MTKIISFLKKYPMSILLAIIAINLFSISNTLKENGKLERDKQLCARQLAFSRADQWNEDRYGDTLKKMGLPDTIENVIWVMSYCNELEKNF